MKRKLRMGMVGGGLTSFIGPVHRKAAGIDGEIELVCGAFSIIPGESKATGEALYLDPSRVYETYPEMFEAEKKNASRKKNRFCFGSHTQSRSLRTFKNGPRIWLSRNR